jgi:hypothetical protein
MRCSQARKGFVAYLDAELGPKEAAQLAAHLATCESCRRELEAAAFLQERLRACLESRARYASPSQAAWRRLQAALARDGSWLRFRAQTPRLASSLIPKKVIGRVIMRKAVSLVSAAAVLAALVLVAFAPPVRAEFGKLMRWFRFSGPGGGEVSIAGEVGFTPWQPTYLPDGFKAMVVGMNPQAASLTYWNARTNQLLVIDELVLAPSDACLPEGEGKRIKVNGQEGLLRAGLEGEVSFVSLAPTPEASQATGEQPQSRVESGAETISYSDGRELIWCISNVRIKILSTLPEEEMLKVAESLAPAQEEARSASSGS